MKETKDEQIKRLLDELLQLVDLSEKNRLIGFLEGMLAVKRTTKENS